MTRPAFAPGEYGEINTNQRLGKWRAWGRVGHWDGSTKQHERTGTSRTEARRRLLQLFSEIAVPPASPVEIPTLSRYVDVWLADLASGGRKKPQTMSRYREQAEQVRAALGEHPLPTLSAAVCKTYLAGIAESHPSKARGLRNALNQILDAAVADDAVPANTCRALGPIPAGVRQPDPPDVKALTREEVRDLRVTLRRWHEAKLDTHFSGPLPDPFLLDLVAVLAGTGCRIGDALALRWSDLELQGPVPTASICGTIFTADPAMRRPAEFGVQRSSQTKTNRNRLIVLPRFTVNVLAARKARAAPSGIDAVFPTRTDRWRSTHNTHNAWRKFRRETGLPDTLTFRALRKAVASAVAEDLGEEQAQLALGHADVATTRAYYIENRTAASDVTSVTESFSTWSDANCNIGQSDPGLLW